MRTADDDSGDDQISASVIALEPPADAVGCRSPRLPLPPLEAVRALAKSFAGVEIAWLFAQLRATRGLEGPIVLTGGLVRHQPRLEAAVRGAAGARSIRLEQPPVEDAACLADQLSQA